MIFLKRAVLASLSLPSLYASAAPCNTIFRSRLSTLLHLCTEKSTRWLGHLTHVLKYLVARIDRGQMIACPVSSRVKCSSNTQAACRKGPLSRFLKVQGGTQAFDCYFCFGRTSPDTQNSPPANIMELDIAADVLRAPTDATEEDYKELRGKDEENRVKGDITNIPPCICMRASQLA